MWRFALVMVAACGPTVAPYRVASTPAGRDQWTVSVIYDENEEKAGVALAKAYERAGIDCPAGFDIVSEKPDQEVADDTVAVLLVIRCRISGRPPGAQ